MIKLLTLMGLHVCTFRGPWRRCQDGVYLWRPCACGNRLWSCVHREGLA